MSHKMMTYQSIPSEVLTLVDKYKMDSESLLEILFALQENEGELHPERLADVARALKIPAERVYGIATFYSMLVTPSRTIRVCDGPACWLRGAGHLRPSIEGEYANPDTNNTTQWTVERTSCLGLCDYAPAALVGKQQYGPLNLQDLGKMADGWRGDVAENRSQRYSHPLPKESRVLLDHAGDIDPDDIQSALDYGVYQGLEHALHSTPEAVINEIEAAELRGRGGAGFPTGRKMRFVIQGNPQKTYVVCNADESEPLVFKDRVMLDTNPHKVLEGIILAAYAIGAHEGFIYIRGEYAAQADRLERAIIQAERWGWLGENIRGSNFSLHLKVHRGAGAYICGEETALLESLEGKRGEPRIRPPFPASYGYHGFPTLVNNVETYANIPGIIAHGAHWYRSLGSSTSSGTKLYTLLGHVNRPGLFEAPFGLTLRQIIDDFGAGMLPGSEFYFAITGGAAGTIVPAELLDIPIDYASAAKGVSLGAGAFLICDQAVSPVRFLREILYFFEAESCGKCTPCRIGTFQARELLDHMIAGQNSPDGAQELLDLAELLQNASFCGLGQSAAIPIKSALKYFGDTFKGFS